MPDTVAIEPEWAMATLAFVDIRGFTSFADRSSAVETVRFLNEFFALTIPVVTRHGGSTNKLLGDGFLASFGAPQHCADHADRAIACSADLCDEVESHFGARCRIGIGLNSGLVLVGTIGGPGLSELGLIGDPVNVAARVQDATRELGESILATAATRALAERDPARLQERGALTLRGKPEPVGVYAVAR